MKKLVLILSTIFLSMALYAQTEMAAYCDKEGNWIIMVEKSEKSKAELKIYDRNDQLITVRSLPKKTEAYRIKLLTSAHEDSVFRAELVVAGESELPINLVRSELLEGELFTAQLK